MASLDQTHVNYMLRMHRPATSGARRCRRRVRGVTVRPVAMGVRGLAALALAVPPALAASPGPYAGFEQGAYLAYLNAPARGGDLTRPPRLRISFGGRSYAVVITLLMDTGVTAMYLTVPDSQAPDAILTSNGRSPTLVDGTKLTISIPTEAAPQVLYSFTVGRRRKSAGAGAAHSRHSGETAVR
jgi:hypothetical protein